MESNKEKMKILWAIDAFDDLPDLIPKTAQYLNEISKHVQVEVEPIYVLSPQQLSLSVEFSPPWVKEYVPAAQKAIRHRLKDFDISGLTEPKILVHYRSSLKGSIEILSQYAEDHRFNLVVVGSHGRQGLKRMFLGSFAESFLLLSKVPVMVIGAACKTFFEDKNYNILFPTDFSETCSILFYEVLRLAKILEAKITLLHAIPKPVQAVLQSGVYLFSGGWVPVPVYLEKEINRQKEIAENWAKRAKKQKISFEYLIDHEAPGVTESIINHAIDGKATLIAMAAQSGPIASALIGSITRQVVRSAPCPVWIMRTKV